MLTVGVHNDEEEFLTHTFFAACRRLASGLAAVALAAVGMYAAPANASVITTRINESGVTFNEIFAYAPGGTFIGTGLTGLSLGSWTSYASGPGAWAEGPTAASLTFSLDVSTALPTTVNFFAINNGNVVDSAAFPYSTNGSLGPVTDPLPNQTNAYLTAIAATRTAMPEPASFTLLGMGFVGLVLVRWRKPATSSSAA